VKKISGKLAGTMTGFRLPWLLRASPEFLWMEQGGRRGSR